jgi:hypothetical protein
LILTFYVAIEAMNGQFLCNRAIHVSYAYKKDGSKGERHGSAAGKCSVLYISIIPWTIERILAAKRKHTVVRPSSTNMLAEAAKGLLFAVT